MRTHRRSGAARLAAVFTGIVLVASVPVGVGAGASQPGDDTAGLRAEASSLAARADAATLELYSLETQLARAGEAVARIRAQQEALAREHASARARLAVARRAVQVSHAQLAELARALYEQPGQDPLAVVLGARSLEEALAGLDGLDRAAGQSNRILEQARGARSRLAAADARFAARRAALAQAASAADARAAELAAAAASRREFVAGLRRRQGLNAARIAAIEREARAAATPVVALSGEQTLTVSSTGYSIVGRTATGIRTAPGVVAVDPSVIPLGTRLTIPGYGVGVAADTGGAIQGAKIDLWFPTTAEALEWGHRTVTITIH